MESSQKNSKQAAIQTGRWSKQQHQRFMLGITYRLFSGLMTYGKDWKNIEKLVGTRSGSQVRSHAQKFFNKIQKDQMLKRQKQSSNLLAVPKNNFHKKEGESEDISGSQYEASKIGESSISGVPNQLFSFIHEQLSDKKQLSLRNFRKNLSESIQDCEIKQEKQREKNTLPDTKTLLKKNSFKGMDNILSAYQNIIEDKSIENVQNESFFIRIAKKYQKYFTRGGEFEKLIDFGSEKTERNTQQTQKRERKRSFTIPGTQQNEEELNQRRKRIIQSSSTSNMTPQQLTSFMQISQGTDKI